MIEKNTQYEYISDYIIRHSNSLINYARQLTMNNNDDALDLYQDTVYRSLSRQQQYRECGTIAAWIYTIMRNIYFNNQKRNTYRNTARIDDTPIDNYHTNDDNYSVTELYDAIKHLNEKEKRLITLYLQGYAYEEIAQLMHMKEGTVKSGIYRAKQKLRKLLE